MRPAKSPEKPWPRSSGSWRRRWSSRQATAEVLHVIASSPGHLEPVFQTALGNATRICDAKLGVLFRHAARRRRSCPWRQARPPRVVRFPRQARMRSIRYCKDSAPPSRLPDKKRGSDCRRPSGAIGGCGGKIWRRTVRCHRADAEGRPASRRVQHLSSRSPPVHRQAGRTGAELRRPGRDRHREHAAAERIARAHRRSERVAGAADRDLGGVESHLQLARRSATGVRCAAGERNADVRRQVRRSLGF